jgi:hypothetical protein
MGSRSAIGRQASAQIGGAEAAELPSEPEENAEDAEATEAAEEEPLDAGMLRDTALHGASSAERLSAVDGLAMTGAIESLAEVAAFAGGEERVQLAALDALSTLHDAQVGEGGRAVSGRAIPDVLRSLDDPKTRVYESAADLLQEFDDGTVTPALWDRFLVYLPSDLDRAETILDALEYFEEEVDEAYEALDYYDDL